MDDLISRAEAIKAICEDGTRLEREGRYILLMPSRKQRDADILSALPTVDAVPVVHGKWIHDGYDIPHGVDWMHCSVCGQREPYVPAAMTNYCTNCGARMDEKDGDGNE